MTVREVADRLYAHKTEVERAGFFWKPGQWQMWLSREDSDDLRMDPAIVRGVAAWSGSALEAFMGVSVHVDPRLEPGDIRLRCEVVL